MPRARPGKQANTLTEGAIERERACACACETKATREEGQEEEESTEENHREQYATVCLRKPENPKHRKS